MDNGGTATHLHASTRGIDRLSDVVDDGTTYRGTDEVRTFLSKAGSQFTYTTTLVGAERRDETHWVAVNRLAGDFPGGVVDLRYRFAMHGDLVAELVVAP